MRDDRIRDIANIRIENADHDDEFDLESVTLDEALSAAYERVREKWNENFDENAGTDGFPSYGMTVELYDVTGMDASIVASCRAQDLYWDETRRDRSFGELSGKWHIDDGIMTYEYEF